MANMRIIVQYAVPVFTGILGLLWLFGRKKGKKRSIKDVDREISTAVVESINEETKLKEILEHKENKSQEVPDSKPEIFKEEIPVKVVDLKLECENKTNIVPSQNQIHRSPSSTESVEVKVESKEVDAKLTPSLSPNKANSVHSENRVAVSSPKSEDSSVKKVSIVNKTVSSDSKEGRDAVSKSYLKDTVSDTIVQSTGEENKMQVKSSSATQLITTTNTTAITTTTTTQSANTPSEKVNKMSSYSPKKSVLSKKLSEIDNNIVPAVQDCVENSSRSSKEISAEDSKDSKSLPMLIDSKTPVVSKDKKSKSDATNVKETKPRDNSTFVKDSSSAESKVPVSDYKEKTIPIVVETMQSQTSQVCRTEPAPKENQVMQACAKNPESNPTTVDVSPANSESPGCDSNSEASNDSGRGGSVTENLSSMCSPEIVRFEFNFPSELCGRLIGKQGKNINAVKEQSGANVALQNNPYTPEYQICVVEGTQGDVERALSLIRHKFPRSQFSQLDMNPINQPLPPRPAHPVLMPNIMQLSLPEGVSVDVVVSSIVDAGHVFVQQPTHPSFPSLERLDQYMMMCYTQDNMVPPLPHPIEVGVICVAPAMDGFYRAEIVQVHEETNECDIKFVDYGGYERVPTPQLKQIRSDFMTLPFQAVECYIYNITPLPGEEYFSDKAASVLEELTQGQLLQAQVINRADDGVPYIHIYQINGDRVIFINRELVNRKVTRGIEIIQ